MPDNTPIIFEDLPREEQTALRKSFAKETREGKALSIASIIMAVAAVTVVTILLITKHNGTGYITLSFFLLILSASRETGFSQWLEDEKGILRRQALKKKEKKSK